MKMKNQYIPFSKHNEPERKAVVTAVDFDASGFSHDELQILGNLSEAVDRINPIFQSQMEDSTPKIRELVKSAMNYADSRQLNHLQDYLTILDMQNSPFETTTRKNHLLQIPRDEMKNLSRMSNQLDSFNSLEKFFYEPLTLSKKVKFYPEDMTEQEFENLGEKAKIVNSTVSRRGNNLEVEINEQKYRDALEPVIKCLEHAIDFSANPYLSSYLCKKRTELASGSANSRFESDLAWIKNDSRIDLILGTATEVYLDGWKGIRGAALGNIMVVDRSSEKLLDSMLMHLPELEKNAPWDLKSKSGKKLPRLKSVNCLNRTGDYVKGNGVVVAQSLPNEDSIVENYGSVNLIYKNVTRARHAVMTSLEADEFLIGNQAFYKKLLPDAEEIHFALHELGHTTGTLEEKFKGIEANEILQEEYSVVEESRAELFTLYALPLIVKKGVISSQAADAVYHEFLLDMVTDLKYEPKQTHQKARNMIYHYFIEKGAVGKDSGSNGKTAFCMDTGKINKAANELLAIIGNIKSSGNKNAAAELKQKYCFTDSLQQEIEARTKHIPSGIGLIYPQLKKKNGLYTAELEYPESYSEQPVYGYSL
ncbi:MAG: hypothetical protein V1886_02380 [archaeon]